MDEKQLQALANYPSLTQYSNVTFTSEPLIYPSMLLIDLPYGNTHQALIISDFNF
ncbi:Uncharacterised protein [Escherichia coli]|nr:Uncharacterised protein [Escherichia coli]CAD5646139.1 Uncharacterised protein [Escherichia coli]